MQDGDLYIYDFLRNYLHSTPNQQREMFRKESHLRTTFGHSDKSGLGQADYLVSQSDKDILNKRPIMGNVKQRDAATTIYYRSERSHSSVPPDG